MRKYKRKLSASVAAMSPFILSSTYNLDLVTKELGDGGIFSSTDLSHRYPKELGLIEQVRKIVSDTIDFAVSTAKFSLIHSPKYEPLIQRFYDDLPRIAHLIERNKNLGADNVVMFTDSPDDAGWKKTRQLLATMDRLSGEINEYLSTHRLRQSRRRNHDPLSREYIISMFFAWGLCRGVGIIGSLPSEDFRPFSRFLAAAWRDAGFPLTDHRGKSREPLEAWFADRIRKRFSGERNSPTGDFELYSLDD